MKVKSTVEIEIDNEKVFIDDMDAVDEDSTLLAIRSSIESSLEHEFSGQVVIIETIWIERPDPSCFEENDEDEV